MADITEELAERVWKHVRAFAFWRGVSADYAECVDGHRESRDRAEEKLADIEAMTDADIEREMEAVRLRGEKAWKAYQRNAKKGSAGLREAADWLAEHPAPTRNHERLWDDVLASIEIDEADHFNLSRRAFVPEKKTCAEWREQALEAAREDLRRTESQLQAAEDFQRKSRQWVLDVHRVCPCPHVLPFDESEV